MRKAFVSYRPNDGLKKNARVELDTLGDSERCIRELVKAEVPRFVRATSRVLLIEEMEVCSGRARVDLAVIGDRLIGIEIKGPKRVQDLLRDLNLLVEAHLVIRGSDLMTEDEVVADSDSVEIRPVISGGNPA